MIVASLFLVATLPAAALPVADVRIHDPVMIKEGDVYYLFGTGRGISVYHSRDLLTWTRDKPVFDPAPAWTFKAVREFKGHIWAPDISYHDGIYYLYYAISSGGKITSAIGVATNKTLNHDSPDFAWMDRGMVIQSVPNRDLWNAIDAQLVVDHDGTSWMAFGSFWSGLKLVKLDASRTRIAEPQEWQALAKRERSVFMDDPSPEPAALEAPFIFRKGDYYYLFVSWDYCCRGVNSDYKMVVGRSKELRGPYRDKDDERMDKGGGSLLLAGNANWPGVGHNSVYTFDGKDYLVFHAYDARDRGWSKLKILEISWDANGWPTVSADALD
jgi:arabinan endo-1,5-alpha-L-arabinosidase